jgi:hypothetical protein
MDSTAFVYKDEGVSWLGRIHVGCLRDSPSHNAVSLGHLVARIGEKWSPQVELLGCL